MIVMTTTMIIIMVDIVVIIIMMIMNMMLAITLILVLARTGTVTGLFAVNTVATATITPRPVTRLGVASSRKERGERTIAGTAAIVAVAIVALFVAVAVGRRAVDPVAEGRQEVALENKAAVADPRQQVERPAPLEDIGRVDVSQRGFDGRADHALEDSVEQVCLCVCVWIV